jgi:hypothetical protein
MNKKKARTTFLCPLYSNLLVLQKRTKEQRVSQLCHAVSKITQLFKIWFLVAIHIVKTEIQNRVKSCNPKDMITQI